MTTGAPDRILLVGMMGAGKSTVGRLLAERLERPYLDSDDEILRRTGRTVPEIWHAEGEAAFRREEAAALADAVAGTDPIVVSVAGGAVLDPVNRELVRRGGLVVWLRARVSTLTGRVGDGHGRPLLEDDPVRVLAELSTQRAPVYEDLADLTVDVDDRSPDEIVDAILDTSRFGPVIR
ncbi:MAG: shikimate kinase [Acidimicrobiales bacterium]